uniref:DNA helicase Pif1-like 2B domain-containing protein n=1 Tax=Arundo donax TaxID=35708 RepID=A0A0A9HAW2_ARUDO
MSTCSSYLSYDTCMGTSNDVEHMYPKEYLNRLKFSGTPDHELSLKVGLLVMLLRTIDQSRIIMSFNNPKWPFVMKRRQYHQQDPRSVS